ncbi:MULTISPECIES: hypothetical protein [unclassified Mesorhizobium]|uniref:hypothetical protein n=1 Tax=unclassified Mesorhizobium TaxID=325217 RepID=UPI000F76243E|nr:MULTISPECIES: hypothetical protein [unclassified Mesorhizobium]AZO53912.1 hypothetical protein EJ077_10810 [Mesorhizobium sp. M8A.F.Ca.ET.057.01.1.1]RWE45869.1 MAG: hypothetical protein EOS80_14645 [Mesorhizobium sp.]TJX79062.1 MAG: hypothetical protein E5W21_02225 [Mesorhizobium sp.]
MQAVFNKNFLVSILFSGLILVGFWMLAKPKQPAQLPTFGDSVAKSLDDGVSRYGAEGFRKKNEQEFRDAVENFQKNGPKAPGTSQ